MSNSRILLTKTSLFYGVLLTVREEIVVDDFSALTGLAINDRVVR